MDVTLLVIGILCLVAAVVGGGLKLAGAEFPPLASARRQLLLALVGLAAAVAGVTVIALPDSGSSSSTNATAASAAKSPTARPPAASPVESAPADDPTITAEPDHGVVGSTIVVSGSGFAPHEKVRFDFAAGSATAAGSCSGSDCSYSSSSSGYAAGSSSGSCSGSDCGGSAVARSCSGGPLKDIPADGAGAFRGQLLIPEVPQHANVDLTCLLEAVGLTSRMKADTPFHITSK